MNNGVNNSSNNQPVMTPITNKKQKKSKQNFSIGIIRFLIIIIIFLVIGLIASTKYMNQKLQQVKYDCTPIGPTQKEKELDVQSTLVKSLYNKVVTNIYEDIAEPFLNDQMKLYLAYRQILEKEKYDSHCNQFSPTAMEPYTCTISKDFVPKAFKEETLIQKIKELYGENITLPLKNIQLGRTCIVGYQYIESRGEFVEGTCREQPTTSFSVTKSLKKAISTRNTIQLIEEVKYYTKGGKDLPVELKSGTYRYTFRLDMNYNYVLIDKSYEEQY